MAAILSPFGSGGGAPSGPAGGQLSGTYPNPSVAADLSGVGGPSNAGLGLALQSTPIKDCNASTGGISSKRIIWMLVTAELTGTVTDLGVLVTGAGVTADGTGINGLGLFTEAGTLLSHTGDMSAAFASTGVAEAALLVAQAVTEGVNYYVGVVSAFSGTLPQFANSTGSFNFPTVNTHFPLLINTAYAAWASFTPGSQSQGQSWFWIYGR